MFIKCSNNNLPQIIANKIIVIYVWKNVTQDRNAIVRCTYTNDAWQKHIISPSEKIKIDDVKSPEGTNDI